MKSLKYYTLLIFSCIIISSSFAGNKVKIDLDEFMSKQADTIGARDLLKEGNKLFNKGVDKYEEALAFFYGALAGNDAYEPLNYKIGVSLLHTNNKEASLAYFEKCYPDVSPEYYLMLGRAQQYNLQFDKAIASYNKYYAGLKPKNQKKITGEISKLLTECRSGKDLIKDTLMSDILPLMALNSPQDDYQPFYAFVDSTFFFTSNRESKRKVNENFYYVKKEQVELQVDTALELQEPKRSINSKANNAALSYNPALDVIIGYNGKVGKGDLFLLEKNKKGTFKNPKYISNKINSKYKEGTAVFLDLKTIVFSSNRPDGIGGMDLYVSYLDSKNRWSNPVNLGSHINTIYDEEVCAASADGRTLYFSTRGWNSMGGTDIFGVTVTSGGAWSKPVNLGYPVNTPDNDVGYLPLDTNKAIIVGTRPEGEGGLDLFKITLRYPENIIDTHFSVKGKITDAESLEPVDSADVIIYNVFNDSVLATLTTDSTGFFYNWFPDKASIGFRVDAEGYNPLVKIFDQEIGEDTLYFVALELSPEEVVVEKVVSYDFSLTGLVKDKQSGEPLTAVLEIYNSHDSLLKVVNTNMDNGKYLTALGDIRESYYFKVISEGYNTYDEVLVFNNKDSVRSIVQNFALTQVPKEESLMFAGMVINAKTMKPIKAEMKFIDPVSQQETIIYSDSLTGRYNFLLNQHHSMVVELRKDGYFFAFEMIPAPQSKDEKLVKKDFAMKPVEKGEKIVLNNILFETGKAVLTKDSYIELDKLVRVMLNTDKLSVEISGHTDSTGGYALNKKLSEARAKAVVDYLIASGVEKARLKYAGYGPDQPVDTNDTKEGRANNRRVEMKIID